MPKKKKKTKVMMMMMMMSSSYRGAISAGMQYWVFTIFIRLL